MLRADHAYYMRRADEERAHVEHAATPEAKSVHQQLRDLYPVRAGLPVTGTGFTAYADEHA